MMGEFYIVLPLLMLGIVVFAMCLGLVMTKHAIKQDTKKQENKNKFQNKC